MPADDDFVLLRALTESNQSEWFGLADENVIATQQKPQLARNRRQ